MLISLALTSPTAPRKSHNTQLTPQKYCSDRCRREKPRPDSSTEADIESAFVRLLGDGTERKIVQCEEVEHVVFTMTRRRSGEDGTFIGPSDADGEEGQEAQSSDGDEPEDEDGGVRLPSHTEHATATTSTKPELEKRPHTSPREWGMQKAKEREMVRRAARRGVAFGFETQQGGRRRVEAVQRGRVVESSFAKGEWGVRWKE